jgi:DNA-directed RNA polymerase subunit RPC12/RpoP
MMMSERKIETVYSTDGIKCPCCGYTETPDEASYYDQGGYDFECSECEAKFTVVPYASWSWTSRPLKS